MKTLMEVQAILGDRIDETLRTDLSPEDRAESVAQSALVLGMSKQMINLADVVLRAEKLLAQNQDLDESLIKKIIGK